MKVLSVLAVAALLAMPAIQGCSMMPQSKPVQHEVVPVKQDQILSVTIIEGKTTKKEIIDALGTPSSLYSSSIGYTNKDGVVYQIHLIQKDGTQLDYELVGGTLVQSVLIHFDPKSQNSIVSNVSI